MTFTKQVFQDIVLPINVLEEQINVSEKLFDTYPILVYPCRIYDHGKHTGQLRPPRPDQMCPGADWGMFNDLGVYGVPGPVKRKQRFDAVDAMRKMEKYVYEVSLTLSLHLYVAIVDSHEMSVDTRFYTPIFS